MVRNLIIVKKCLMIGIILLSIGNFITPSTAQKNSEPVASTFEGKPDLTINSIIGEYYLEGATCKCVVKNIGTVPSADYTLDTYGYAFFGLVQVWWSHNYGGPIEPGETTNIECGCPYPYFGFIRYRCFISTSIAEENYYNNRFFHSYLLVNRDPFWVFKELPW